MSAKVIYSFTDEKPDLQKQIGCMNGIFQLFDRQHFLTGRRASHKRLPPGQSDNDDKQTSRTLQKSKDSNPRKDAKEKHRSSTESSRTSFSSSTCSSTFSSIDCNKIALLEPSKNLGHKSFDLRDIVKESINREVGGLSVNTVSKEPERHAMKHIDSPRPLQLSKTMKPRVLNHKEPSRSPVKSKDAPRFSYDGRESREKGNIKLKELPRLSLDSRVSSTRRSSYEFKSNYLTGNQMENEKIRRTITNTNEDTESYKRPSSVVAKLMGLDALPDSMLSNEGNNMYEKRISCSPRNRHQGDTSQSPTLKNLESPTKAQTVYGEIEKRLSDLEFRKSGKDLRALKQILQAMQKTKETLETKQDQTCSSPSLITQDHSSKIENPRNLRNKPPISSILKHTSSPRKNSGSPTVIMKPATLARKYEINPIEGLSALHKLRTGDLMDKQTYKDRTLTPRDSPRGTSNRFQCSTDKSFRTRIKTPETSGKSSGSLSPRLQCKQPHPTTPLSDSSRHIRESSRHLIESNSPRRKIRLSSPSRENSTGTRCSSQQSDANSLKSESSSSFLSQMDPEISSTENYEEIVSHKHRNPDTPEQPSPVSVLDAMFYKDDLPSPMKMISHDFEGDDGALFSDEPFWTSANLHQISNSVGSNLSFDIEHLVQNKTEDHKYISKIFLASRLLSSDISSCLLTIQLHPTDYIINPDLFLALEQISSEKPKSISKHKIHRKLIFDTVNEILVGKLVSQNLTAGKTTNGQQLLKEVCSEIDQLQANNSSNSILGDDSDFFSNILWEDLKKQSPSWTALGSDVSGLVLDIERSIFKDLVTQIVNEEATGIRTRIGGRCRKLFVK